MATRSNRPNGFRIRAVEPPHGDGFVGYRPGETILLQIIVENTGTTAIGGATVDLEQCAAQPGNGYTVEADGLNPGQVTITDLEPRGTVTIEAQRAVTMADFPDDDVNEKTIVAKAHLLYPTGDLDMTASSEEITICRSEYAVNMSIVRTNKSEDELYEDSVA